jgi:hypothetical protein
MGRRNFNEHGEFCRTYPSDSKNEDFVFGDANKLIAWLGEETADSRGAFEFLEKAIEAPDTDDMLRWNEIATYWDRVRALLRRPYFSRVWVVQEIAITRQVTLLHGDTSMDWRTFEAAVAIFQKRLELYPDEAVAEERHRLMAATRFIHVLHRCFIRDELGNVVAPAMSLERLVFDLSDSEASDVRDKIYALLAIAADIDLDHPQIIPDYGKASADVFAGFYKFCIETSGSLNVILRPQSTRLPPPLWSLRLADGNLFTS